MNKFLIVLVLITGFFTGFSQAPGYMGKRFSAGYGIYASPGFIGSEGLTPVNLLHEGFIEFATGKKFSVGFSARFYKAVAPNSVSTDVNVYNPYVNYVQQDAHPYGVTHLNGRNYMLYGKFFKKKFVAPWGRYFTLGATLNTYTASYDPDQMYISMESYDSPSKYFTYYTDFGPTKQSYMKFDVMFGNGRTRIIANRIALDYGYNIHIWSLTSGLIGRGLEIDSDDIDDAEYVKVIGSRRLKGVNGFNIFFKVAYLF